MSFLIVLLDKEISIWSHYCQNLEEIILLPLTVIVGNNRRHLKLILRDEKNPFCVVSSLNSSGMYVLGPVSFLDLRTYRGIQTNFCSLFLENSQFLSFLYNFFYIVFLFLWGLLFSSLVHIQCLLLLPPAQQVLNRTHCSSVHFFLLLCRRSVLLLFPCLGFLYLTSNL